MARRKATKKAIIKEINRELKQRDNVYPRWISSGKLNRDRGNEQYMSLEDARDVISELTDKEFADLLERRRIKGEQVQQSLFK